MVLLYSPSNTTGKEGIAAKIIVNIVLGRNMKRRLISITETLTGIFKASDESKSVTFSILSYIDSGSYIIFSGDIILKSDEKLQIPTRINVDFDDKTILLEVPSVHMDKVKSVSEKSVNQLCENICRLVRDKEFNIVDYKIDYKEV